MQRGTLNWLELNVRSDIKIKDYSIKEIYDLTRRGDFHTKKFCNLI